MNLHFVYRRFVEQIGHRAQWKYGLLVWFVQTATQFGKSLKRAHAKESRKTWRTFF
jgi:hypothetical protein